ncbi:hypothetical protein [Ramlibacter sp.]|uniref:hypothetical protein n=1 Tax=Ramlibacter sp. TaxID=1917967 RepID=UPI0026239B96|nr:hypothetical protein [Ramlibacter sp.]MDB5957853.1 hypothetical protein [Ramlibacter sp.]
MHRRLLIIIAAATALACPWAGAQPVFRCGNSYSQQHCAGGGGAVVETGDTGNALNTPPGSVAAAEAVRAEAMEKARLAQEKNAPKALIIGPETPPLREPDAVPKDSTRAKAGKLDQFTAVSPGHKTAKKKPAKKKKTRSA